MMVGILKFYKILNQGLKDPVFKKMYRLNEKTKVCIEIFETESKMKFFIPTVDEDKFLVYRKDDDKHKSQ